MAPVTCIRTHGCVSPASFNVCVCVCVLEKLGKESPPRPREGSQHGKTCQRRKENNIGRGNLERGRQLVDRPGSTGRNDMYLHHISVAQQQSE